MSLIIALPVSLLASAVLFSAFSKIRKNISESLVYKDTPTLLKINAQYKDDYALAKSKGCYGDMGRAADNMSKIKKEISLRMKNVRMEDNILNSI